MQLGHSQACFGRVELFLLWPSELTLVPSLGQGGKTFVWPMHSSMWLCGLQRTLFLQVCPGCGQGGSGRQAPVVTEIPWPSVLPPRAEAACL